jgi:hypothetical protein
VAQKPRDKLQVVRLIVVGGKEATSRAGYAFGRGARAGMQLPCFELRVSEPLSFLRASFEPQPPRNPQFGIFSDRVAENKERHAWRPWKGVCVLCGRDRERVCVCVCDSLLLSYRKKCVRHSHVFTTLPKMPTSVDLEEEELPPPDWSLLGTDVLQRVLLATGDVQCVAAAASTCTAWWACTS